MRTHRATYHSHAMPTPHFTSACFLSPSSNTFTHSYTLPPTSTPTFYLLFFSRPTLPIKKFRSFYADRYHLVRATSAGWVRGAFATAQTRASGVACAWLAFVAVGLHLLFTSHGIAGWPHDGLCPTTGKLFKGHGSIEGKLYASDGSLNNHKNVDITTAQVYHRCATEGDGNLFFTLGVFPNIFPRAGDGRCVVTLGIVHAVCVCVCRL